MTLIAHVWFQRQNTTIKINFFQVTMLPFTQIKKATLQAVGEN